MRSIRIFAKNMGDPYYEPTIVVHDNVHDNVHLLCYSGHIRHLSFTCPVNFGNRPANFNLPGHCGRTTENSYHKFCTMQIMEILQKKTKHYQHLICSLPACEPTRLITVSRLEAKQSSMLSLLITNSHVAYTFSGSNECLPSVLFIFNYMVVFFFM